MASRPRQQHPAGLRRVQPGQHAQQGALARAVGAPQGRDLAGAQLQARPAQDGRARVAGVDRLEGGQQLAGRGRLGRLRLGRLGPGGLQAAAAHRQRAPRDRAHPLVPVLGEHHGGALLRRQPPQHVAERRRRGVVELRGGLVHQQHRGPRREHRGQGHPLALAPRERRDRPVGQVAGAGEGQRLAHALGDRARGDAGALQAEGHVARDRAEHGLALGVLEDHPGQARDPGRRRRQGVVPGHGHAAREAPAVEVGHQAAQRAQQRRLPLARGSLEQQHLARGELEVDPVQGRGVRAAVGEGEALGRRRGHGSLRSARAAPPSAASRAAATASAPGARTGSRVG